MVFKIKKIKKDNIASFGTMFILVPFIICTIITIVMLPIDETAAYNMHLYQWDFPEDYQNMSTQDLRTWMNERHGGNYTEYIKWGELNWDIPFFGTEYCKWPDGFECPKIEAWRFFNGQMNQNDSFNPDYINIAKSILTLDPPKLNELGTYGTIFRILMGVIVAIGLADVLWPG